MNQNKIKNVITIGIIEAIAAFIITFILNQTVSKMDYLILFIKIILYEMPILVYLYVLQVQYAKAHKELDDRIKKLENPPYFNPNTINPLC